MKITINKPVEMEAKYLHAQMEIRYVEDATVNDQEDTDGDLMPHIRGDMWDITIDIDNGRILNWPEGVKASTHYKVCDAGVYRLLDQDKNEILEIDGYVPSIMCPGDNGYGDYVIMVINENGMIQNWRPKDIKSFVDHYNESIIDA